MRSDVCVRACGKIAKLIALSWAVVCVGCATTSQEPPAKPVLKAFAFALPAVANVIPVYVAMECRDQCEPRPYICQKNVAALSNSGQLVSTLELDQAVASAGGALALSPVVKSTPNSAVISQMMVSPFLMGGFGGGGGAMLGLLIATGYAGYLYSDPEAMAREKLRLVVLPDNDRSRDNPGRGWVFFPKGNYRQVELSVMQDFFTGFIGGSSKYDLTQVTLPWVTMAPGTDVWVEHGMMPPMKDLR